MLSGSRDGGGGKRSSRRARSRWTSQRPKLNPLFWRLAGMLRGEASGGGALYAFVLDATRFGMANS